MSINMRMNILLKSITPLTHEMYHYSGVSLQEYWNEIMDDTEDSVEKILNGTLSQDDIDKLEEELTSDAECGALWNYVHIAKKINLEEEIVHTKKMLLDEPDSWDDGDKIDDICRAYCLYSIGKYEVYSFQIDATCVYNNLDNFEVGRSCEDYNIKSPQMIGMISKKSILYDSM